MNSRLSGHKSVHSIPLFSGFSIWPLRVSCDDRLTHEPVLRDVDTIVEEKKIGLIKAKKKPSIAGMTHVRTSPNYPQSNGKLERWHKSLKNECIRPGTPLSVEDAKRLIQRYVDRYNNVRLRSATGYITPKDVLAGRQREIHAERDRKLEAARQQRQSRRQQAA